MRRTPGALALYVVVTVFFVGATTAFVALNKRVTISEDGETRQLTSFADNVGAVLDAAGVDHGPRDMVVPAPSEPVESDTRIVVTHARKLELTVNGESSTVWVTANTVREALQQLDVDARGAELSAARSDRLPLSGSALNVRLPRTVTIEVGDTELKRQTTARTVGKVLDEAGIELGPHDRINVDPDKRPEDGQVVKITQLVGAPETRTIDLDYETVRKSSDELAEGENKVVREGREGVKKITVATIMRGGEKVEKVLSAQVTRQPRKEVVKYGTQDRTVESVADLNWSALAECESGGDPNAVNPAGPYYGLYQFDKGTWQGVGGEGVATDAPASEQTYRAQLLYKDRGDSAWPECGTHLHD